jgi:hypothetical protein
VHNRGMKSWEEISSIKPGKPRVHSPQPVVPQPGRPKVACHGCGEEIVYPPARVCTLCLMTGVVTEEQRAALEEIP